MTNRRSLLRVGLASSIASGIAWSTTTASVAAPSAKPSDILIGQSTVLSGGSAALGTQLAEGTKAYFEAVNARGGVQGRPIRLKTLDDGYDPKRTVANTEELVADCLCLTGYYGTPTTEAALPVLEKQGVPLVGFVSGATIFRNPLRKMVFNVRASYDAEIEKMIEHNELIGVNRFAILYQDDSFGKPCLATAQQILARRNIKPVAVAAIVRNASSAKEQADSLGRGEPQAILVFTTLQPTVLFIREMLKQQRTTQYMVLSPIGADALSKELGPDARGVGISQVFPHPMLNTLPVIGEYQSAMKRFSKFEPSYYSLEGYLNAGVIVQAMGRVKGQLTRDAIASALKKPGDINLGGFSVRYAPDNHEGSRFVELTVVGSGGKVLR
jgi:branched-chain amino acid transport system substrate-binding protein